MCGASGTVVKDLCLLRDRHENARRNSRTSAPSTSVEKVWKETQQLMEQSEHLVRIMTHVCSQQLSGVFRTVAKYSQDCWRRCSVDASVSDSRRQHFHPLPLHQRQEQQQHCACCEGCGGVASQGEASAGRRESQQQQQQLQEACRWRAPPGWWRWRRWWGRCQCGGQCQDCSVMDSGGSAGPPAAASPPPAAHQCPCPALAPARTPAPTSSRSRSSMPSYSSILTLLLLLVATLPRFTEGCSSRSTPKPRPPSPTMRPNITFQTYSCPPAYAAWYCLNGATCFTVKIGESILYNCECADGYMGQRCEFKDLDGSYLPARERVLLETASIAGGATVACVFVFVILFAMYVIMQKDKDKRCRDSDDGRNNDRQPFSGYQNPRPEIFRTISNPYARTIEELSHVEVQPASGAPSPNTDSTATSGMDTNKQCALDPS
ncbi:uncharacterized protein LOC134774662 isoform X1 [Penaeus indicus]|uniref:uncharacterized protein LOC134774662 isoform X1 n=2 Tax=Penaeus TaxID=133894 RepID=UPI00300CF8CA